MHSVVKSAAKLLVVNWWRTEPNVHQTYLAGHISQIAMQYNQPGD